MINQEAICGCCDKEYGNHYFENEVYCFENTTGDIFTDEPNQLIIFDMMHEKNPELYEQCVSEWKIKNGHKPF